jgi:hypothetical protein
MERPPDFLALLRDLPAAGVHRTSRSPRVCLSSAGLPGAAETLEGNMRPRSRPACDPHDREWTWAAESEAARGAISGSCPALGNTREVDLLVRSRQASLESMSVRPFADPPRKGPVSRLLKECGVPLPRRRARARSIAGIRTSGGRWRSSPGTAGERPSVRRSCRSQAGRSRRPLCRGPRPRS